MEENEKKTENFSAEQNNESREGYQSTGRPGGYQAVLSLMAVSLETRSYGNKIFEVKKR